MQVKRIVVSTNAGNVYRIVCDVKEEQEQNTFADAISCFLRVEHSTKITFSGRTSRGHSGISLAKDDHGITLFGHKPERIPEELMLDAEHHHDTQQAFQTFLTGMTICLNANSGQLLLKWDPFNPEVFANNAIEI